MIEVQVTYEGRVIPLQCNGHQNMKDIFLKFCTKAILDINSIYFVYNGNIINEESHLEAILNQIDKGRKKITILAFPKEEQINRRKEGENKSLVKAEQIICPKCGEISHINIKDYIINIYGCKNNHSTENILLENFEETQKIDEAKIICNKCNTQNKKNAYNRLFYFCWNCKLNLCPLCKEAHDKSHYIEDYNMKNYICPEHGDNYYSYCQVCNKNICSGCENDHINHDRITFGIMLPKKEDLNNQLIELNNYIKEFKNEINLLKEQLNYIVENMEHYLRLVEDIYNSYNIKKKNYEVLKNINQIKYNNICVGQELEIIKSDNEIIQKFKNIINIFYKMKNKFISKETNYNLIAEFQNNKNKNNLITSLYGESKNNYKLEYNHNSKKESKIDHKNNYKKESRLDFEDNYKKESKIDDNDNYKKEYKKDYSDNFKRESKIDFEDNYKKESKIDLKDNNKKESKIDY